MLKAPLCPQQKPKAPDPNNKKILPDENTWLWNAFETIKLNLEKSIQPLSEYVKTFQQFEQENKLNPDRYVKIFDDPEKPMTAEDIKNDIQEHRMEEERLKN